MRLDCAIDNAALNQYYKDKGYQIIDQCKEGLYKGNRREKWLNR